MSGTSLGAVWKVETVDRVGARYRFTNLLDHTAWQVSLNRDGGETIAVPGHVGYARGSFEQDLAPGDYWLTWVITPSMLPPRSGLAVRPVLRSATFRVPLDEGSPLTIAEEF